MRERIVQELGAGRRGARERRAPGARAVALERRPRAVRLRRLARPAGAAAQGGELLPGCSQTPLPRPARRARRPVHRLRRRRREAHADADQRPARVLARRPRGPPAPHGRARRRARGRARPRSPAPIEETGARDRGRRAAVGARRRIAAALAVPEPARQLAAASTAPSRRACGSRPSALDGDWEIAFATTASAIEPEYAERVFLIFQRLHGRDAYEGSGIGLALCRKIVEYHGGRIWLDTDHGGGASFRFTLPAIGKSDNDGGDERAAEDPAGRGRSGRRACSSARRSRSARPVKRLDVVGDGVEAMRSSAREGHYAARERPDLILLDLNLPRKSGRRGAGRDQGATRRCATIPVVVLTTSKADEDVMRAYRDHANAYVTKPVGLRPLPRDRRPHRRVLRRHRAAPAAPGLIPADAGSSTSK